MTDPLRIYVTYIDRGRLLAPEVLDLSHSEAMQLLLVLLSPGFTDDFNRTVDSIKICNAPSAFGNN